MITNPFGLVYDQALTENKAGQVTVKMVHHQSNGIEIATNLYKPAGYSADKTYPAITVAHPNGGVKEQVAGFFAQKLAEAAHQGASGGLPRNIDYPVNRVEDIRVMADYLETVAGVDKDRIGSLGICGGDGYTIEAVKTDKRFKAVATVSMFNSGRVRRNGFLDSQLDRIQDRLQAAAKARSKYGQLARWTT
ncbi:X-Pro dipeptidyl-peptidase [Streptococcus suis]|uniref:X-Pro dipeptidyl-peptidase n=1 Tax=Streptococcus suis TaxID=1307 RepID=A0AB33UFV7_STRSU|nr:alpha/beta hydrolase [Streptococcus suis]CYX97658.1 X-Pro dipeptidyl-peptidase [Streptococcus suis]